MSTIRLNEPARIKILITGTDGKTPTNHPDRSTFSLRDLAAIGAGKLNFQVRALIPGSTANGFTGGDFTVTVVGDSGAGVGVTVTKTGDDITIHYESGVSTAKKVWDALWNNGLGTQGIIPFEPNGASETAVLTAPGDNGGPLTSIVGGDGTAAIRWSQNGLGNSISYNATNFPRMHLVQLGPTGTHEVWLEREHVFTVGPAMLQVEADATPTVNVANRIVDVEAQLPTPALGPQIFEVNESVQARRRFFFWLFRGGKPVTGASWGGSAGQYRVCIARNDGTISFNAGIGPTEVSATQHPGLYYYDLATTEINQVGRIALQPYYIDDTDVVPLGSPVVGSVVSFDPYDSVRLGLTALPNAAAEATGGLITLAAGSGSGQVAVHSTNRVYSDVRGWNGVAPDALQSGKVPADVMRWNNAAVAVPGNAGYPEVDVRYVRNALINALQSGRIDSYVGAMAADVVTAAALAADAVTEIATGILDSTYEGLRSVRGFFRVARSILINRATDLTTAPKYRDDANTKDRVSFTMSSGNAVRTPVVDET